MIYVFKTSVKTNLQVQKLKSLINKILPKENGISTLKTATKFYELTAMKISQLKNELTK